MPRVTVYNMEGEPVGERELSERVFGAEPNPSLLHQAVVIYLQNQRSGSASTKTRAMVRGGGKKPWKQKHTGRARQGSIRAPHWRGGGVVFGPHPRDWSVKFPQKMRQAAIRQALSAKVSAGELTVVDRLTLPVIRTKSVLEFLDRLNLADNALLITAGKDEVLKLSARNLPKVATVTAGSLNAYTLLKHTRVVLAADAVDAIEGVFGA
jgi:large subunit ribosomal protein L4